MFEIRQEHYSGPLDKLLELIDQKQIEITRLSLADVTADFIRYVSNLEKERGVEPAILADFVVIAARMLLLKSKVLLPSLELTEEEEGEILDLEERLKLYREFKGAAALVSAIWEKNTPMFSRQFFFSLGEQTFFYPPKSLAASDMAKSLEKLFAVIKDLIPETRKVKGNIITLQEKIAELTKRLQQAAQFTMRGSVKKAEKEEIVVLFLAVLHMLASRIAEVEQGEHFGDIIVKKAA